MKPMDKTRRHILKVGMTLPIFGYLPWKANTVQANSDELLPDYIYRDLYALYGKRVYTIAYSDLVTIKTPEIAENGSVVPITIIGEVNSVTRFSLFIDQNRTPLACSCFLSNDADLRVSLRVKLPKTSDIYLITDTHQGLLASKQLVKVTMGCGG